jgi:hypothetical protein
MDGKYFLKQESLIFKIIYIIGIIAFFKHLNDLTIENNEQQNLIFPMIAFSSLILFFIRFIISDKKDNDN